MQAGLALGSPGWQLAATRCAAPRMRYAAAAANARALVSEDMSDTAAAAVAAPREAALSARSV
jgi:hypothetical protein